MITAARLKTHTVKDLAAMAKRKKISGWHSMRKDELIKALVKHAKVQAAKKKKNTKGKSTGKKNGALTKSGAARSDGKTKRSDLPKKKVPSPYAKRRLREIKKTMARSKDLAFESLTNGNGKGKDRLVVMVRDPYWLHAYWELTRASIDRARAALGQHWHAAKPVLRLHEVSRNGITSSARRVVRDIEIHGGVNNWYIDVKDPPNDYQVDIGYKAGCNKFLALARSNVVSTPQASLGDSFDTNWTEVAKDSDRIYAMSGGYQEHNGRSELKEVFEERLRRPMGGPVTTQFGLGAAAMEERGQFPFEINTELIVHGTTDPDAHVTLRGEPVHLRSDGTFAVRFTLPDRRHVLPVVASSSDGVEEHTIVLAVDRNTKVMEPVIRCPGKPA